MNTDPFWLADYQAPAELKNAYKDATRNKSVTAAASRVVEALHRFIDETSFHHELQCAVQEALNSGRDVACLLEARKLDVLTQIEALRAQKQLYKEKCLARQVEVQPVINSCMTELFRLGDEIKLLQSKIKGFELARIDALERYRSAGLTDADIDAIGGVKPTYGDLTVWKVQLAEKQAREEQISRFYKSSPEYDISILGLPVDALSK